MRAIISIKTSIINKTNVPTFISYKSSTTSKIIKPEIIKNTELIRDFNQNKFVPYPYVWVEYINGNTNKKRDEINTGIVMKL